MKVRYGLLAMVALFAIVLTASAQTPAPAFFYMEVPKDGRIYVFADPDIYKGFSETGTLGTGMSRIGEGPNGETLMFDSEAAFHLYRFKHNLPDEVIPHAPPAPPKEPEKSPWKFSGLMFGDYFYNTSRDPNIALLPNVATPGAEKLNGFQFRRIYFTFDDTISEHFTTRFRLEADQASLTNNNKVTVFVKDAWLYWKNISGNKLDMYFGFYPTAAYDISETAWAYRSLEKTIMDLRGVVPSRDLSAGVKGRLDDEGKWNYWFAVGNNSGNSPEADKFKRVYFNFWGKPTPEFQFTVYFDYRAGQIPNPNDITKNIDNNGTVFAGFANYHNKDNKWSVGAEVYRRTADNGYIALGAVPAAVLADRTDNGESFWAWANFNPKVGVVGRFDIFEPNKDVSGDKRNLFIAALVLKPYKSVWIMPNVEVESYEDKSGVSFDNSVTPRITLYWSW